MKKVSIDNSSLAHTKWDGKYHIYYIKIPLPFGKGIMWKLFSEDSNQR